MNSFSQARNSVIQRRRGIVMSVEMSFGDFSILNFGVFLKPAIGMGLLDGGVPIYLGTALFWVYLGGSEFLFGRP